MVDFTRGFSNEGAKESGFPTSGEMGQMRQGLPPQRKQQPFEHNQQGAQNPFANQTPIHQPVQQATPAAQGSQFRVKTKEMSPAVASFLRTQSVQHGSRGLEGRLGGMEQTVQGLQQQRQEQDMQSRVQAAAEPMARMMMRQQQQAAQQQRPGGPPMQFDYSKEGPPGGGEIPYQGESAPPPQAAGGAAPGGPSNPYGPQAPQQHPAAAPQPAGDATPAQPDEPGGPPNHFAPGTATDTTGFSAGLSYDENTKPPATPFEEQESGSKMGDLSTKDGYQKLGGDPKSGMSKHMGDLSTKEGWNKATNGMAPSMGGLRKEIYDIAGKLGALTEKGGALHKGMLEQAKSQIQKQKDTLHAALAEAGGGILAGGSPLLAQESVNAAKAMVDAEYKFALAQSQLYGQQAGILAGLLAEQGRMDLAEAAQKLAQDKFAETKDMNAWKKKYAGIEAAINFIKAYNLDPDDATIGKLAGILAGDIEVSDEEIIEMFAYNPSSVEMTSNPAYTSAIVEKWVQSGSVPTIVQKMASKAGKLPIPQKNAYTSKQEWGKALETWIQAITYVAEIHNWDDDWLAALKG